MLGQILIFLGVGPNPGSRPSLIHPTRPKYQKEHNLPGPIEATWAQVCCNWPELAIQMLVGIRICKRLGSTRNSRNTMHVMEGMRLGGTRNLRDTMHVVEPHDATEIYETRNIRSFGATSPPTASCTNCEANGTAP
jgi:hypothetical protein